ncbi:MAG: HAMP domain-containing histidine kinase [Clostridiales bacterium]|nr:HAMP domain-containing histidine kinase [Clostridiales bacterium]
MIKKLRIKFIILSTISLLLLLAIIVISGSLLNYRELVENADMVITKIAGNEVLPKPMMPPEKKVFPEDEGLERNDRLELSERSGENEKSDWNEGLEWNAEADWNDWREGFMGARKLSPEIMYEARFFTAVVSADNDILFVNTENIAMIDDEAAEDYAELALNGRADRGFIGDFRYIKVHNANDTCVVFLDCGRNLSTFRNSVLINCIISFMGLLFISVIIVIFSKKIVSPVAESYEKQKQFISVAGHEIKTPITIIDADAEILSMDIGDDNEWLQDICKQTRRMSALTEDLLQLSRMDENRQQFTMIDFPISDVVSETVQSFQTLAKSKGRHIDTKITPMLSYNGDEEGMRHVVGIILDNAIKYTKENEDGSSDDIILKLEKKNHNIVLCVSNRAQKVSDEQLRQFFDRFYRTEQSRDSEKGGYGLGLAIAKSIVEAHKGKITASMPDTETIQITVVLPNR